MNFTDSVSKAVIQIKESNEFFGALMLFSEFIESKKIDTAATDGKKVFVNKNFFLSLTSSQQNGLLLHEVLHMALLHIPRMGERDQHYWNVAADIVVNDLILSNTKFKLPDGGIVDRNFKGKSVEHVYEKVKKSKKYPKLGMPDLIICNSSANNEKSKNESEDVSNYWKDKINLLKNTDMISKEKLQGFFPGGIEQEIEAVTEPEIDWRSYLWKFVCKTPTDFDDIDRRFIHRKLYLEYLMSESVTAEVCIDTSGSVSDEQLEQFFSELKGILSSYPHVNVNLYYCDTEIYGPYKLNENSKIPAAKGRGGTTFIPFFNKIEKVEYVGFEDNRVAVYLTDGYGDFPKNSSLPTLWLVTHDGLGKESFPFGETIRISK